MKNEYKKITLIIDELVTLLLHHGAKDITIQINKEKAYTSLKLTQHDCDFDEEFVDQLRFGIQAQRQNEIEGYYWQLVGKDDSGDELHLIGAMIDESKVSLCDHELKIFIKRIYSDKSTGKKDKSTGKKDKSTGKKDKSTRK